MAVMSIKANNLVVIDVESTCWEKDPPPGERMEIIEIGVCVFNRQNFAITDSAVITVKPEFSKISSFCTELTTITGKDVENGIKFKEACDELRKRFKTNKRAWASWGDYDRKQFERQCINTTLWQARWPFGSTHLNLKYLFSWHNKISKQLAMNEALQHLGLELEGTHHRALDDCKNICTILKTMITNRE